MLEKTLQNALIRELSHHYTIRVWRQNTGKAVPLSTVAQARRQLELGNVAGALATLRSAPVIAFSVPGAADLTGIGAGRRLELELKAPGGMQSDVQKNFQNMIDKMGGVYIIGDTVEAFTDGLRDERII